MVPKPKRTSGWFVLCIAAAIAGPVAAAAQIDPREVERTEKDIKKLERDLASRRKRHPDAHDRVQGLRREIAAKYMSLGRFKEAHARLKEVEHAYSKSLPASDLKILKARVAAARPLVLGGKPKRAQKVYLAALKTLEDHPESTKDYTAFVRESLAIAHYYAREYREALAVFEQAVKDSGDRDPKSESQIGLAISMGAACVEIGELKRAVGILRRALKSARKYHLKNADLVGSAAINLAAAYISDERYVESIILLEKLLEYYGDHRPSDQRMVVITKLNQADALIALERLEEARAVLQGLVASYPKPPPHLANDLKDARELLKDVERRLR